MRTLLRRFIPVIALLALGSLVAAPAARAQAPQASFQLGPGQVATITFEAFCVEFGKFFPETIVEPKGVAPEPIRAALAYVQQKGLAADPATAFEANLAIWKLAGASRAPAGGAVAQDVLQNGTTPPADPQGTSIVDAAAAGDVRLTLVGWQASGDKVQILSASDHFYGRGTLTVENISQQTLTLYMPIGTLFPGNEARFQTVGGYAVDVQTPRLPQTGGEVEPPLGALLLLSLALLAAGRLMAPRGVARLRSV